MPLVPENDARPEDVPLIPEPEAVVGLDRANGSKANPFDLTPEVIRSFLLDLIPAGEEPIRWIDSRRNGYEASPLLPLEQQFLLVEHAKALGGRIVDATKRSARLSTQAVVAELLGKLDRSLLDELNAIAEIALPDALALARERYGKPEGRASSFFPGEELLKALLPFYARPLVEVMGIGRVTERAA